MEAIRGHPGTGWTSPFGIISATEQVTHERTSQILRVWRLDAGRHPQKDSRLTNALFRIPDYQRGYAWEERQLEEFWADLTSVKDRHYMGALTVERHSEESGRPVYDVVDGQQRLTTISLLLSTLGSPADNPLFAPTGDGIIRFSYADNNEDRMFFESLLKLPAFDSAIGDAVPDSVPPRENRCQKNLLFAKQFFSLRVAKEYGGDSERKQKLFDRVFSKLVFDFRVLGDNDNAEIIFETMNNRGKSLTLLEKLKNRLMYLSEIADDDSPLDEGGNPIDVNALRKRIHAAWGDIYRALASNRDRDSLDEDEFVAAHLSVYRNPKENVYSEAVAESRLFKMFCTNPTIHPKSESVDETDEKAMDKARRTNMMEEKLSLTKIKDYVDDIRNFAPAWADIHKQFENACGHCRILSGTREVKTFLAAVWLALPKNEQEEPNGEDGIFTTTETLLFRNTVSGKIDKAMFSTLARRLHGKCLDQLKGEDKEDIGIDQVRAELKNYLDDEKWKIDANALVKTFSDRMARPQSPYGFYGWSGLKYFLFTQESGEHAVSWDDFDEMSIEHIIPQSATEDRKDSWWERQIKQFVEWPTPPNNEKEEKRRKCALVNSLGNFVLLTRGENSAVSDDPWEHYEAEGSHKEVIGKQAFYSADDKVSSAGARAVAKNAESWNAFRVRERGRELFHKLARKLGIEVKDILQDQIDLALGFEPGKELENLQFGKLVEDRVNDLARTLGTGAEPKASRGAGELRRDFWKRFYDWCRVNEPNFAGRIPNGSDTNFCKFGGNRDYALNFSLRGNLVRIEIYADNTDKDDTRRRQKNEGTMARLMKFQSEIEKAFASGIDPRWTDHRDEEGKARVARFCRPCAIEHPTEETFHLMVADAKTLVEVLNEHGEDIQ